MRNEKIYKLTLTALMAALSYVVFTFLQIKITLPGGDATSFHLGNAVCVLGALLLGGVYGGIGGAIGYFYKRAILGKPAAEVALAWNITTTGVNAVLSVIAAVAVYMALCPALKKSGLLLEIK